MTPGRLALALLLLLPACADDGGGEDEMVAEDESSSGGDESDGSDEGGSTSDAPAEDSGDDAAAPMLQRFEGTATLENEDGQDTAVGSEVTITVFPDGTASANLRLQGTGFYVDAWSDGGESGAWLGADGTFSIELVHENDDDEQVRYTFEGSLGDEGGSGTWGNVELGSPTWYGTWAVELAE